MKQISEIPVLFALAVALCLECRAADWTGFQNGGRPVVEVANFPTEWSAVSGIAWQKKLSGYGQSSPVVSKGQIYVTSVSGPLKDTFHAEAFDLKTGKKLWQIEARNSSPVKSTTYVSKAAPSPVCDGDGVIALFEGGNLLALTPDGKKRWDRDLVADYGGVASRHGLSSSLEQNEKHVFVWIERSEKPYVLAVSKKSGKTVWKTNGLGVTSWASPRLVPAGVGHHLVLSGIGKLAGLDPGTGKRLWDFDRISGNSTPTPCPMGAGRFLIGATTGRGESGGGKAADSNGVIQISGNADDGFSADWQWQAEEATSSFGSPVAANGLAWFVNRAGVVYCLDAKTGKEQYAMRTAGSIWATPIVIGENVYLFGKDGGTTVLKVGAEYQVVAKNELWKPALAGDAPSFGGPVLYAAVAADSVLLLRRGDRLFAVHKQRKTDDE